MKIKLYVDGSCRASFRGGWAFIVLHDDHIFEDCGSEEGVTNQQMELLAVRHGIAWLFENEMPSAEIVSDSAYVIDGMTKWIQNWNANGWRTSAGETVKHKEIWEELLYATNLIDLKWTWVKAHNGDQWNEYVDSLASMMSESSTTAELISQ